MDHPYLVVHSATAPGAAEATKKLQEEEAQGLLQGICGVCHDPLEDPVVSSCKHAFCRACMTEYMDGAQGQAKCPSCDKPLTVDLNASASVSSLDLCTCIQYQDIYIYIYIYICVLAVVMWDMYNISTSIIVHVCTYICINIYYVYTFSAASILVFEQHQACYVLWTQIYVFYILLFSGWLALLRH